MSCPAFTGVYRGKQNHRTGGKMCISVCPCVIRCPRDLFSEFYITEKGCNGRLLTTDNMVVNSDYINHEIDGGYMGYFEIRKSDKNTQQPYYFVLKAPNNQIIAHSEMYSSKQAAENGIASVQANGCTTDIRDKT